MKIVSALAADLDILTAVLDEPGADVACTLLRLGSDVEAAVPSYLGLSVTIDGTAPAFAFTTLVDGAAEDVCTSLRLALPAGDDTTWPSVDLVLYAGTPGAFVDLAADLAWLTGWPVGAFALDRHVGVPDGIPAGLPLRAVSAVNQAIGMLIGRGHTPAQAYRELDGWADAAGTDRQTAAQLLLDTLSVDARHADGDLGID